MLSGGENSLHFSQSLSPVSVCLCSRETFHLFSTHTHTKCHVHSTRDVNLIRLFGSFIRLCAHSIFTPFTIEFRFLGPLEQNYCFSIAFYRDIFRVASCKIRLMYVATTEIDIYYSFRLFYCKFCVREYCKQRTHHRSERRKRIRRRR